MVLDCNSFRTVRWEKYIVTPDRLLGVRKRFLTDKFNDLASAWDEMCSKNSDNISEAENCMQFLLTCCVEFCRRFSWFAGYKSDCTRKFCSILKSFTISMKQLKRAVRFACKLLCNAATFSKGTIWSSLSHWINCSTAAKTLNKSLIEVSWTFSYANYGGLMPQAAAKTLIKNHHSCNLS